MNGLEAFEIEQLLGIYVYATWIYYLVTFVPPQLPQAMALSSCCLLSWASFFLTLALASPYGTRKEPAQNKKAKDRKPEPVKFYRRCAAAADEMR